MPRVVKNSPWCLQGLDEGEPRWSELPGNTFLLNFAVFHVASTRAFGFRARRLLLPVRNSLDQHHIKWHFVLNIFREVRKVKTRTETPWKTAIEGESFLLRLLRTASLCVFHVSDKKKKVLQKSRWVLRWLLWGTKTPWHTESLQSRSED